MKNKKGQVGETLTWIVATILIVIMMIFFIFGASMLGGTKKIGSFRPSLTSASSFEGSDPFLKKSIISYLFLKSEPKRVILDKTLARNAEAGNFSIDYNQTKTELLMRYSKR
ncbi:hypothetical protein J4412_00990 [Candidatus Pacearchaeota archaeon]|nr:hypothetical protein [Candidatus Pacearchaeota archaeon]HIH52419.1 hypothetical protein [Nanoarchaeota archaeon]